MMKIFGERVEKHKKRYKKGLQRTSLVPVLEVWGTLNLTKIYS